MVTYQIRTVTPADLQAVTDLEAVCFSPATAASRESFAYRISAFPERFFVAEAQGRIIGIGRDHEQILPQRAAEEEIALRDIGEQASRPTAQSRFRRAVIGK